MLRKALCVFMALLLAVSLCACKKEYQSFDIDRDGGMQGEWLEERIAGGESMTVLTEGSRLWKKFVKCAPSLPMETDADITEYAWEIRDILVDRLYLRESEFPIYGSVGSDEVMILFYSEKKLPEKKNMWGADGNIVYVYVSLETGAVLAIQRWRG